MAGNEPALLEQIEAQNVVLGNALDEMFQLRGELNREQRAREALELLYRASIVEPKPAVGAARALVSMQAVLEFVELERESRSDAGSQHTDYAGEAAAAEQHAADVLNFLRGLAGE